MGPSQDIFILPNKNLMLTDISGIEKVKCEECGEEILACDSVVDGWRAERNYVHPQQ